MMRLVAKGEAMTASLGRSEGSGVDACVCGVRVDAGLWGCEGGAGGDVRKKREETICVCTYVCTWGMGGEGGRWRRVVGRGGLSGAIGCAGNGVREKEMLRGGFLQV